MTPDAILTDARERIVAAECAIAQCRENSPPRHGYECKHEGDGELLTTPCDECGDPTTYCTLCVERKKDADVIRALLARCEQGEQERQVTDKANDIVASEFRCMTCGTAAYNPNERCTAHISAGDAYRTEREMHNAWRKRAEAAEATLAEVRQQLERSREGQHLSIATAREQYDLRMKAEAFLEREGYRQCDIPACNCGSWHQHGTRAALLAETPPPDDGLRVPVLPDPR